MHLGCLVITTGQGDDWNIPAPPVVWCDKDNFMDKIRYYVENPAERRNVAARQKKWALKYATYDYAARNVLNIV